MNDRRRLSNEFSASSSISDYDIPCDESISTYFESDIELDRCSSTDSVKKRRHGTLSKLHLRKVSSHGGRHELCGTHENDLHFQEKKGMCERFQKHTVTAIEEKADHASQRLLSARKVKINELKSEVYELKIRVKELIQENRLLKQTQNRHEKELTKIEEQKADLPNIIRCHAEEIRVLKKHLYRTKERSRNNEYIIKRREDELEKVRTQLVKFSKLANDNKLQERGDLQKKLTATLKELSEKNNHITELNKTIELTEKNHKYQLKVKAKKYKEAQKKLNQMQDAIDELNEIVKDKNQKLENQNIYSNRIPSKSLQSVRKLSTSAITSTTRNLSQQSYSSIEDYRYKTQSIHPIPVSIEATIVSKTESATVSSPDLLLNCEVSEDDFEKKKQIEAWKTPDKLEKEIAEMPQSPENKVNLNENIPNETSSDYQDKDQAPNIPQQNNIFLSVITSSSFEESESFNLTNPIPKNKDTEQENSLKEPKHSQEHEFFDLHPTQYIQSVSPLSINFASSVSPISTISTGFNTPSTVIEFSPDISHRDNDNKVEECFHEQISQPSSSSEIINSMLMNKDDPEEKLTFYFSAEPESDPESSSHQIPDDLTHNEEQFYSDSSNSSNSNNLKTKRKYFFSRPIENLHRGRPAHGANNNTPSSGKFKKIVSLEPERKYSFGSYRPSFGQNQSTKSSISSNSKFKSTPDIVKSESESKAARKAKLMAELFGSKNNKGGDPKGRNEVIDNELKDNKRPSVLQKNDEYLQRSEKSTQRESAKLLNQNKKELLEDWINDGMENVKDDIAQNFGHSPFAFDEIAPRSRRSGKVSGLNSQTQKTILFSGLNSHSNY